MNSRLESLIKRGYPRDIVVKLSNFTDEELEYASKRAFEHISRNCNPVEGPIAIYVGGQPGSGKTVMSMNLKREIENIVEIGIDNYRMYHPHYLEIEKVIREFWKDKTETINDTPGNDIADFTHYFAGAMTDRLMEMAYSNNYNMLLEWGMREPTGPLRSMQQLKDRQYKNIVLFVATNKDVSYEACNLRADIMKNNPHIIRKVPKSFHDLCVSTLSESINKIHLEGYSKNIIDKMAILTRSGKIVWDDTSKEIPGDVYNNCLNGNFNEKEENSSIIAVNATKREFQGLRDYLQSSKRTEQSSIYINPLVENLVIKK